MILFHSLHVTPKQDYLHSIYFHLFPFLYFKTSNQGYLIPFHSIPFFSIQFLYLNTFHSILFSSLMIIPFHSFMNSQMKPRVNGIRIQNEANSNRGVEFSPRVEPNDSHQI